ncbi:MAG: class I SAM-dependent methyltransferase [Lautropia sp.]
MSNASPDHAPAHPPAPPASPGGGFPDAAATWNRRFAAEGFLFGTEPNRWLADHASCWRSGGKILSVADGEGRNSVWLAARGFRVDAFDIARQGIDKARALARERGVEVNFVHADCDGFDWKPAHYDGIAAIFVQFADPSLRARLFAHCVESLAPGGTLVLQGYTPKQLEYRTGGPPVASHLYTEAMLRDAFRSLDIVELREYEAELAEGTGHAGRSALIGMVATKPAA